MCSFYLKKAVFMAAFFLFFSVSILASFSMRQVQELALTLALSAHSAILLVLSLLFGTSCLWRDIEKRYVHSVLSLPRTRQRYLLGKFASLVGFLLFCSVLLGLAGTLAVLLAARGYPADVPVLWLNVLVALLGDLLKSLLLAALALLFSTLATSFYLPFLVTLALYLCGSASQQVYEYLASPAAAQLSPLVVAAAKGLHFVLPNFALFDFKVAAIYALPLAAQQVGLMLAYFVVYTALVLLAAVALFNRRQFP